MYWLTATIFQWTEVRSGNAPALAQNDGLRPYQQRWMDIWTQTEFSSNGLISATWILMAGLLLLALIGTLSLWRLHKQRRLRSAPLIVFHSVATEMGLKISDQWLLSRIASHARVPSPITLLLSGATLRHHGKLYVQSLSPARRPGVSARIERIAHDLLDVPAGESITLIANPRP